MVDEPPASGEPDLAPPNQERPGPAEEAGAAPDEEASVPFGDGAGLQPSAETELWTGRTDWRHFGARIAVWLLVMIAVAATVIWAASASEWLTAWRAFLAVVTTTVISGLVVTGRVFLTVIGRRYRLTSQRLFIERGILSTTTDQTELIRVDDVRVCKSLMDRVCGLGTVELLTTDATDKMIVIEGIAGADEVGEAIRRHMRLMRRKSLFVENL